MRNLWNGSISFGLVTIPVKLYAATEKKDVKFNYLHETCKTPIRYQKVCPTCGREVGPEEIVLGYEYEKGRYVVLREEDFQSIPAATAKTVDIVDFVDLAEIDPIYFDKTYFLEPAEGGSKAYALLRRAMKDTGRIAIARVVIRSKESLAAVRAYGENALVLNTMHWPDEIRTTEGLTGIQETPNLDSREVEMAVTLVDNLTAEFRPEKYDNEYRRALFDLIRSKVEGEAVEVVEPREAGKVVDLMDALRASIRATA